MVEGRYVIRTRQMRAGYGSNCLVGPVDIRLHAGELVCLMGTNGSGKTTFLRVLAGLLPALGGTVDYAWPSGQHPRNMAVVLTDKPWNRTLTVSEVVRMGRYPYPEKSTAENSLAARRELDRLNLSHLSDKPLEQLSDGQRQLVMIARALAQEPQALLMDEPTSHLDLNHRVEIMNRLADWCRESPGRSVLMATHELDLALQRADRLWIVANGQLMSGVPEDLVLNGTLDEVFRLKGFTLKTGKVDHKTNGFPVRIVPEDGVPTFGVLWTRNALERNGYPCGEGQESDVTIGIRGSDDRFNWILNGIDFDSVEELLQALQKIGN